MILQAEDDIFLQAFVLKGLIPLANERTIMSLFYVLKGRKSNQTEQDTHMFALFSYYRIFPALTKEEWEEIIHQLVTDQMIQIIQPSNHREKETFTVTPKGIAMVQEWEDKYSISEWSLTVASTARIKESEPFWMKLHLMSQTFSHLLERNTAFFPVVTDKLVQNWVKEKLRDPSQRELWMRSFAAELYQLLIPYPVALQRLLIHQLSGTRQAGCTLDQLARMEHETSILTRMKFRWLLIDLITSLQNSQADDYPLFKQLIGENGISDLSFGLSHSAAATYRFLQQSQDLDQIAQRRGLRKGTIEDHLVEIVLHCPEWDHTPFLTHAAKTEIISASQTVGTKRLRVLREYLENRYTYLQIRLALAQVKENA